MLLENPKKALLLEVLVIEKACVQLAVPVVQASKKTYFQLPVFAATLVLYIVQIAVRLGTVNSFTA